ncbi:MAG: YmdB family metallophosphoesterase [Oscillospiraceae bacterium]|nr:YmdB family metallophosphoesterase [Oscillospiraceae bacterium]
MKLLFVGDVVGSRGCAFLEKKIHEIKRQHDIGLVIVNGENSADGNGLTRKSMNWLFTFADVITTGNHCFRRKQAMSLYDDYEMLLRPANFPQGAVGHGVCTVDMGSFSLAVVNLMGTAFMESLENPFHCIDRILEEISTPNILVDFHAEATSEKKALGHYLTGRVTAVVGTHTHVQTSDELVLGGHTAYITDVGMCGAELSVLGVKTEQAIYKQLTKCPVQFTESDNSPFINAVTVDFDSRTGKAQGIERLIIR